MNDTVTFKNITFPTWEEFVSNEYRVDIEKCGFTIEIYAMNSINAIYSFFAFRTFDLAMPIARPISKESYDDLCNRLNGTKKELFYQFADWK